MANRVEEHLLELRPNCVVAELTANRVEENFIELLPNCIVAELTANRVGEHFIEAASTCRRAHGSHLKDVCDMPVIDPPS